MHFQARSGCLTAPAQHRTRTAATVALALSLTVAAPLRSAADALVPADLQAAIITRLLGYDRALKNRVKSAVVIGVVVKPSERSSAKAEQEIRQAFEALGKPEAQGLPLRLASHSLKDIATLGPWLTEARVSLLYVTPGLEGEVDAISKACADAGIPAVSPVRSFVERGLAVGVILKSDRAGILVNLPVARAAGMDLDPKLLGLSEVIR
jgi:S1-C subfamily serine protease